MSQQKENKGGRCAKRTGEKAAKKPPRYTGKALVLYRCYIALTIISAVIVAGYVAFCLFSAPPDMGGLNPDNTRRPQTTMIVDENGNEVQVEIPGLSADRKDQFYTFLLVGQDTLGGGNTDTMMLAAYDVPNQVLNVMSLPRDTYVSYYGRKVLLNSVYNRAGGKDKGIEALKAEVGELTGVTPDYHVIIQWEALGELVDAIDGVYFDVPQRMYYNDLSQGFKIDLKAGYQLLDGDKAMQLIRWRKSSDDSGHSFGGYATGDIGRIETQQAFMKAIIAKCLQPDVLLSNLGEYISIFQKNVETNLTVSNMTYFGKSAIGKLDMDDVSFYTMPYKSAGDGAHLLPIGSQIVEMVNEGFNPYQEDIRLYELDILSSISSSTSATSTPAKDNKTDDPIETPAASESPEPSDEPLLPPATSAPSQPSQSVRPSESLSPSPSTTATPEPEPTAAPTPPLDTQPPEGEPLLPPGV